MIDIAKTLYDFWSGFEIPAYAEGAIPENAELPYITYQVVDTDWRFQSATYAQLWYRDTSLRAITEKAGEIREAISEGIMLDCADGFICIYKQATFVQLFTDEEDDTIKRAYISVTIDINK